MAGDEESEVQPQQPLTDADRVENWASRHKISDDVVKSLAKEGFTSLEAIALMDQTDLRAMKIARGQQKLLLKAVAEMNGVQCPPQPAETQQAPVRSAAGPADLDGETNADNDRTNLRQNASQQDDYVAQVLNSLKSGQSLPSTSNGGGLPSLQSLLDSTLPSADASSRHMTTQASWQDPQIHLRPGKPDSYYDIVDFVGLEAEIPEEIVMDSKNGPQLVLRSHTRKPKLESLTLSQWSIANVAILHKLMTQGASLSTVTDYLSHTTRIYQLIAKFSLQSVLLYDRAYRKSQAQHQFRWGTELTHLQLCFLQARPLQSRTNGSNASRQTNNNNNNGGAHGTSSSQSGQERRPGPRTPDGREICRQFNSQAGCRYVDCKFAHVCSVASCDKPHSALTHSHGPQQTLPKNG